ncbi:Rap1a/Tai family immunity protein [Bradyrhizobium sp. RT3a]|uniref:Rap1a/Tai family immunity protein n=1 Tax=unclassified Bradyrhizobium TaxID=2631580 RepID=UPI0033935B6A
MKIVILTATLAFAPVSSVFATGADFSSGNYMLQHCEHYIFKSGQFDVWDGECGGAIATLTFLGNALPEGFKTCPPKGHTKEQAARVVVSYMQNNPQLLNEPFRILAMTALSQAWPCK